MAVQDNYEKISFKLLERLLQQSGIFLDVNQINLLWSFHKHLRKKNNELNLTRIHNFQKIVRKHFVDSLIVPDLMKNNSIAWPDRTIDLGTGAGFPGIPLAIAWPGKQFILAEGRQKRVAFLRETVKILGLKNVEIYGHRIVVSTSLKADGIITRAVEGMIETIYRAQKILGSGGLVIFMKGPNCDREIDEVKKSIFAADLLINTGYSLPFSTDRRRLVVWKLLMKKMKTNNPDHTIISSKTNTKFKFLKRLNSSLMIKKHNQTLIFGKKIIREFQQQSPELIRALIIPQKKSVERNILDDEEYTNEFEMATDDTPIWVLAQSLFNEIDMIKSGPPVLLVDTPEVSEWQGNDQGCILFIPFGDPDNLGAALRSAAAFQINTVVLLKEAAHPFHPRTIRSSAGTCFQIKLHKGPSIDEIHKINIPMFTLDKKGEMISKMTFPKTFGLLPGQEGGLPVDLKAKKVSIQISPSVESLNASVALGIALYHLSKS